MKPSDLVESLLSEDQPMPPTWQITVWNTDSGFPRPFAQIDMIDANGENQGSTSPDDLRAKGYAFPDVSELPSGKYTPDLKPLPKLDPREQMARVAPAA
jgi:hypothetical protein